MKMLDQLKDDKAAIKRENQSGHWIQQKAEIGVAQEKQMEVCDVCGAFLIVNDVQQRVDDHLQGKQHVGYGRLKTALDEILENRKREDRTRNDREHDRDRDRERRDRRDSRDRDRKRDHDRDRHRDRRDREKDRYKRYRSKSPDRSNQKHRSKDRSRSRERSRHGASSNGTK